MAEDRNKTKKQLIQELQALRTEVATLKQHSVACNSPFKLPPLHRVNGNHSATLVSRTKLLELQQEKKFTQQAKEIESDTGQQLYQELIEREQLFAGFFNAATQSNIGLFIVDTNLQFLHINQTLADINGYSIEFHLGKFLPDLLPELALTLTPLFQTLIETRQPISNLEVSGYVPSQPGVLRHWINSFFPISSPTGEAIAIGGIVVEITEYKQAIEALHQSEFNLRTAQRIAHVGSWHWDSKKNTVTWSQEMYRIHGLDPNQPAPQGKELECLIHPDDLAEHQKLVQRAQAGYSFEVDLRIIRPDGEIRYTEARGEPGIYDEQGELLHLYGTALDVTDRKRVEQALRQSEFALREAQRIASVGSWQWQREDEKISWSEEIYRIHGLDPNSSVPDLHKRDKYIHPDDLEIHQAMVNASLRGEPYEYDLRIIRPDGEVRYVEARAKPGTFNERGELIGLFGTVLDVTDRKLVEAQLRQSQANLARAQKIAHIGSWEYDIASQTCTWSEELYRIHQLDPSQKAPVGEEMDRLIHPDDLWIDRQLVKAPLLAGKSCEADLRIVRRDREVRYIEVRGEPVFNLQEQITGWVGTVMDITDRKQAEASLREWNRRWRSLLDQVQLMVVGLDTQGFVEYFNPFFSSVTGFKESEIISQEWLKTFVVPEEWQVSKNHFVDLLEQRVQYSYYQNRIITKSGEERIIVWNNTALQDTAGNTIGIIGIGEDITEQHKLERLKREFVSIVSHELRTPLTSMQVALSLLDQQLVEPTSEEGQGMIRVATEGVDRLVRLVNDILDLEKIDSGKVHIEKQLCYPADLIEIAIEQMKDLANKSNIKFEVSVVSCSIQADRDRLIQVLINLLSNAIRFSPVDSTVQIHVETFQETSVHDLFAATFMKFMVKDYGRGIPSDRLESIFERFQQVDASDSRQKGGTGLGLAICRSIIQQHRGRIWAESNLGKGSSFYFTLPISEGDRNGKETYPIN
ncbi:PAS domain S-box protein [Aerosakkonemataceae cyanobacterium BLCC-F50]|uniref:histidine kinase n=1 Tax=Floridaenema flaviceps BLCC-F50 TaxID=3153642 RepID=A0ABV4XJB9_9CYAN